MRLRAFIAFALTLGVGVSAQQSAPQRAQTTFRSSTHLIVQTITVKDKSGKPVTGLTAKDFIVTENGQRQDIAFVEYQNIDDTTATPPQLAAVAAQSSSTSNQSTTVEAVTDIPIAVPGDARYRSRRLIVLYIDLVNMPFFDQMRVFGNATRFVQQQMTSADLVSVMVFDRGRVRTIRDFTDDRARLLRDVDDLLNAANDKENSHDVITDVAGAFGEDDDTFDLFSTDRQLSALQTAVTDLGPLPERKTLVYFGSGLRLNGADNMAQLRATVNAAVRSNVTINPIDTRGLTAAPPMGDATKATPGGIGMFNGSLVQAATTRQQQSQDTYYALAKDTGGRAMFDNNDLAMGIVQAVRAVTGYYMIGYYSTNIETDGRFRRVKVTLAAGDVADLEYRPGYFGAKDYSKFNSADKERQLEDALKREDPITDIPMAMEINYFQVSSAEYFVPVSLRMPASDLVASLKDAAAKGSAKVVIDMIGEIKDDYGVTIRNAKDLVEFKVNGTTATQLSRRPIQYETGFSLLPGSYTLKMLARDTTSGRIGTYIKSFVVPNLEREKVRLPISSVVLTTQREPFNAALFTVKQKIAGDMANPLVQQGQKFIPGVSRTFSASRELFVYLQAYERDAMSVRPLAAFVTFYRDGQKAYESEPLGVDGWDQKTKALPIRISVPAGQLLPGAYDCQVSVFDPVGNRAAFWRAGVVITR